MLNRGNTLLLADCCENQEPHAVGSRFCQQRPQGNRRRQLGGRKSALVARRLQPPAARA